MAKKLVRSPSYADVTVFDPPFRFHVRSRTSSQKYLVDISAYKGNGRCNCRDFETRFEPLLKQGHKAVEAFAAEVVELRDFHLFEEDCLRCFHIMQARGFALALTIEKELAITSQDATRPQR